MSALRGVSLSIAEGELLALAGPSGSGKSTLLHLLGLIDAPTRGSLSFAKMERDAARTRRQHIAFVFQSFNLMPVLTALENVEYFLVRQGSKHARATALEALERVGLKDKKDQRAAKLSGGQQQRVAIAQAIARKPSVIIADEPTAALDHETGSHIVQLLSELDATVIYSSHDPKVLKSARRVIALEDGRLV